MEYRFHINIKEGYSGIFMQYSEIRTQFATIRSSTNSGSGKEITYDINSDYGQGCKKYLQNRCTMEVNVLQ